MNIKRFNEDIEDNGNKQMTIRVKHLIEYLSQFDPETPVYLDNHDWENYIYPSANKPVFKNELDVIKKRGLFGIYKRGRYKGSLYISTHYPFP